MSKFGAQGAAPIDKDNERDKGRVQVTTVKRYRRGEAPGWLQEAQEVRGA
jgi:hypothetical protein